MGLLMIKLILHTAYVGNCDSQHVSSIFVLYPVYYILCYMVKTDRVSRAHEHLPLS